MGPEMQVISAYLHSRAESIYKFPAKKGLPYLYYIQLA